MKGNSRDAVLLRGVELSCIFSGHEWLGCMEMSKPKHLHVSADTKGEKMNKSKSTCCSLESMTLIDTDISALGFLQG